MLLAHIQGHVPFVGTLQRPNKRRAELRELMLQQCLMHFSLILMCSLALVVSIPASHWRAAATTVTHTVLSLPSPPPLSPSSVPLSSRSDPLSQTSPIPHISNTQVRASTHSWTMPDVALSMSVASLAAVVVTVRSLVVHGSSFQHLAAVRALTTATSFPAIGGGGSGRGGGGSPDGTPDGTHASSDESIVHIPHTSTSTTTMATTIYPSSPLLQSGQRSEEAPPTQPRPSGMCRSTRVAMLPAAGVGVTSAYPTPMHARPIAFEVTQTVGSHKLGHDPYIDTTIAHHGDAV